MNVPEQWKSNFWLPKRITLCHSAGFNREIVNGLWLAAQDKGSDDIRAVAVELIRESLQARGLLEADCAPVISEVAHE